MPAINDEFSAIPCSRQQRWQMRKKRDGKCVVCGKKSVTAYHCERHRIVTKDRVGSIRRQCYRTIINALATGKLKRGFCHCGKLGQAHHENYAKPLQVTWLCHVHHMEHHGKQSFTHRPIRIPDLQAYQRNYRQKVSRDS